MATAVIQTIGKVLYYAIYPFIVLFGALLAIIVAIAAPALHVAYYILHGLWWPFHVLGKFETLYIYFGVAILVGVAAGAILGYTNAFLVRVLGFSNDVVEVEGRTLASYRAEQAEKRARKARFSVVGNLKPRLVANKPDSQWLKHGKGIGTTGLLSTTILEEDDDSSDAGF